MKAIILKTKPFSMFRLGSGSLEETDKIIHSDTLFSALVNIHSKIYYQTEKFIDLFDTGKIKISSAFPMLTNGERKIYFVPKPELNNSTDENIKTEKKIKFISTEILKQHFENFSFTQNATIIGANFAVSKDEILAQTEIGSFIEEIVKPKTKVHYKEQKDNFYHETDIQLIPIELHNEKYIPHFYFLYELNCDKEYEKEFFTCLRILADTGIGGERSTGKGHFDNIVKESIKIDSAGNGKKQLLLSLLNPKSQDEFDAAEHYEIIVRGGGSVSFDSDNENDESEIKPYRKKQVRMISEGSILNKNVEGRIINISPDEGAEHKHFRYGKSFTIPLG